MNYTLKGGKTMTERDFESLSEAAANGDYPGTPGEWVVRPQGRPRLSEEDLVTVAFKVTRSQRDALDSAARAHGESRSTFLRNALTAALA